MIALIPLFPLLGFLINGSWYALKQAPRGGQKAGAGVTGSLASILIFSSFVISLLVFFQLTLLEPSERVIEQVLYTWMNVGPLKVDLGLRIDALSSLFTLVITGVGTLIHVYSIGYMGHDATPGKFFAYLNLFCFAMLMLVMGSSLPILFLGWEGVGLCSYLLIGYWYTDIEKAKAGKKAFVVNRVGDLGFLLGMFLIFYTFGTVEFHALKEVVLSRGHAVSTDQITLICILLFVGCMGKSAQIPLYVWLPDAMAGPTPVSALIHAATMVTSGIYMVSRLNFLYSLSPSALEVMAIVGALTAFFAATVALVQKDIKKVLAYSTVSQLGYMFLACGVGAYTAGIFHVITHAFFKALLFLGAGSVIHGMHEEQNIFKMGGLKTKMPQTCFTFAIGWLAICGIPPFSGFFSKDEILWQAFSSPHGSPYLWFIGMVTAVTTAFYMTRLFYLTFLGAQRFKEEKNAHDESAASHAADHKGHHANVGVHESPYVMVFPLMVLAGLSACAGFISVPHLSWLDEWLGPLIPIHEAASEGQYPGMEWLFMLISVLGAGGGIVGAYLLYQKLDRIQFPVRTVGVLHRLLENKWYIDEIYEATLIKPIQKLSHFLWKQVDVLIIDGVVLGVGRMSQWTGEKLKTLQTGSLQAYLLIMLLGLIITTGYLLYG